MDKKLETILTQISELSVLELSELVKALEEKFDVKAVAMTAPSASAAPPLLVLLLLPKKKMNLMSPSPMLVPTVLPVSKVSLQEIPLQ